MKRGPPGAPSRQCPPSSCFLNSPRTLVRMTTEWRLHTWCWESPCRSHRKRHFVEWKAWTCTTFSPWGSQLKVTSRVCVLSRVQHRDPVYCSPPGSSVHGIFPVRILQWVTISSSTRQSNLNPLYWERQNQNHLRVSGKKKSDKKPPGSIFREVGRRNPGHL